MRVFVTGTTGYLGSHLMSFLATAAHLDPLDLYVLGNAPPCTGCVRSVTGERFDLTDGPLVRERILAFDPDVIWHCAALSQTQACEDDPARAEAANVMATAHLAHALAAAEAARTAAHGNSNSQPNSDPNSDPKADPSLTTTPVHSRPAPLMVLVSTDWAYAASAQVGVPLREDAAEATGFGVYGRSKVAAEAQLRAALPTAHVVLRSALIYGRPAPHAPTRLRSCLGWMVDALLACKPLALFEDEFRTPVLVDDVVAALTACLTLSRTAGAAGLNVHDELARRSASGPGPVAAVFNIAGATRVSRLEMGRLLAAALQVDGELNGTTLAAKGLADSRPTDLTMDANKAEQFFGLRARPLAEGLALCFPKNL